MRWPPADGSRMRRARAMADALRARSDQWRELLHWRGVMILAHVEAHDGRLIELPDHGGAIFGGLFRTEGRQARSVAWVDEAESSRFALHEARVLFSEYWGDYVAFIVDRARDALHVARDPLGGKPCYIQESDGLIICFSDPAELAPIVDFRLDVERVGLFLGYAYLSARATALQGVSELWPGHVLHMSRTGQSLECAWRPPRASLERPAPQADELSDIAAACVSARAQGATRILHRLSGGLDSSIVLGLLCQARAREAVLAINVASRLSPEGDERTFARLACARHGVELLEIELDPADVDYARLLHAPLSASPSRAELGYGEAVHDAALGAYAGRPDVLVTSGQGGDHLFHRSRTPLIAADAVRLGAPLSEVLQVSMETARMGGVSLWRVLGEVLRHGLGRAPLDLAAQFPSEIGGLTAQTEAAVAAHMDHPWLEGWRARPANETRRVLSLVHALHYHAPNPISRRFQAAPLLLSQPIAEWAMAQPGHVLTAGGVERGLYRRTFANLVPAEVAKRLSKGETTRHFAATIRRNRDFLNDLLPRGRLVDAGLIGAADMRALLARLDQLNVAALSTVLHLLAAETWIVRWERARIEPRSAAPAHAPEA
jgi:asparagine synthase (glutamine-hydrolysing)